MVVDLCPFVVSFCSWQIADVWGCGCGVGGELGELRW